MSKKFVYLAVALAFAVAAPASFAKGVNAGGVNGGGAVPHVPGVEKPADVAVPGDVKMAPDAVVGDVRHGVDPVPAPAQ